MGHHWRVLTNDLGKLLLRLTIGVLLLMHGVDKLSGIDGLIGLVEGKGLPGFVAYGVYIGEIVAPAFIVVGFKTRIAAVVFAFNMVVAVGLAHSGDILSVGKNGGWAIELQGMYILGAVCVALLGAGSYSVSRGRGRWD